MADRTGTAGGNAHRSDRAARRVGIPRARLQHVSYDTRNRCARHRRTRPDTRWRARDTRCGTAADAAGSISPLDLQHGTAQAGRPHARLLEAAGRHPSVARHLSGATAVIRDIEPGPLQPEPVRRAQEARLLTAWRVPEGWRYWSEVNNSEVGQWYTSATLIFFLFGGVLAALMRIQLAWPDNDFVSAETYNQIFTLHGSVMMFLFAVPIFEAISIMLLPQMLGARDLPFPRLSHYGFWSFAIGGVFVCSSIFFGMAPRGGWFMYPPLTS